MNWEMVALLFSNVGVQSDCGVSRALNMLRNQIVIIVIWNKALVSASFILPPGSGCIVHA